MGRSVCLCARVREALLLAPLWPALDPRPSLLTGLDSSDSPSGPLICGGAGPPEHSAGWGCGEAGSGDRVLAKGNGGHILCHPWGMTCEDEGLPGRSPSGVDRRFGKRYRSSWFLSREDSARCYRPPQPRASSLCLSPVPSAFSAASGRPWVPPGAGPERQEPGGAGCTCPRRKPPGPLLMGDLFAPEGQRPWLWEVTPWMRGAAWPPCFHRVTLGRPRGPAGVGEDFTREEPGGRERVRLPSQTFRPRFVHLLPTA